MVFAQNQRKSKQRKQRKILIYNILHDNTRGRERSGKTKIPVIQYG